MSCKISGGAMTTMNIIQPCTDVSDVIPLFPQQGLYLKPIARLNISVHLPTLKLPGKTISNYEVMEKLKYWTIPDEFTSIKVSKNTLEFIRFEAEIESRSKLPAVLARLDGRFIKLSGFTESLKVRAAEAKCDFPTRHTWDSYFRDAKNMNEMKPGERPDTIHITNLPCKWFASKSNPDKPSEYILRKVFETFGEVRCVDVPSIDPYRSRMKAHISGIKMFSYHQNVVFEGYVQFREYVYFMKAMDTLRGMKLIHKEDSKIFSASIKVDFDKTKHLSDSSIKKRRNEREKLMAEEREHEEQERLKKEKEEAEKEAERKKKLKEKEEKIARRKLREEKRKLKQLEILKEKEAEDMNRKIASEERLLVMAQRRLESIRLLSELFKRVEEATLKKLKKQKELEKLTKKNKGKKGKNIDVVEPKLLADNEEEELRQKLIEKLRNCNDDNSANKEDGEPGSSSKSRRILSTISGTVPVSSSEDVASLITSSESDMSNNGETEIKTEKNQSLGGNYLHDSRPGGMAWFPHSHNPAVGFSPYPMMGNSFGRPHRPFYPRGRRGFRWPRYPSRGRGGYIPQPYIDPLVLDINHQYYKYFHKLAQSRTSRSSSRSYYSRSRSRSRTRSPSYSRRYSRSVSRSRSRSYSRSYTRSYSRSRSHTPSRSKRRSERSHSSKRSKSNYSKKNRRSRSHSHRSRSRSNRHKSSRHSRSRSKSRNTSRNRSQEKLLHHPRHSKHESSSHNSKDVKDHDSDDKVPVMDKSKKRKTRWDTDNAQESKSNSRLSHNDLSVNKLDSCNKTIDNKTDDHHKLNSIASSVPKSESSSSHHKHKKSPVRFPSLTHTWSRSPSLSSSLSWEKNGTRESKNYDEQKLSNNIKNDIDRLSKKDQKKHKKKKKHRVKEK